MSNYQWRTIAVCDFSRRCGVGAKFSRLKKDKWRISRSSLIEVSNTVRDKIFCSLQ
jgi:hypothetical protein